MISPMIVLEIPGEPVPYARSGARGAVRFTPAKQRNFMALVRMIAGERMRGLRPLRGAIALDLRATYTVPASWSRKRRAEAFWKTSKPDGSNLLKIVEDALNGIVWGDDAQAAKITVEKVYGETACLRVEISMLSEPPTGPLPTSRCPTPNSPASRVARAAAREPEPAL